MKSPKAKPFPPPIPGTLIRLDGCANATCERDDATWYIRIDGIGMGFDGRDVVRGRFVRTEPSDPDIKRGTPWCAWLSFWRRGNVNIVDKVPPRKKATK